MRELRVQRAGKQIRVFYAWDPRRVRMLLIGGDKTDDNQFSERMVAVRARTRCPSIGARIGSTCSSKTSEGTLHCASWS
ncbi:MAG: type II toxin-antitoxin system RelE/ParE family toxin [Gemmatimonadaceae bacterium]